MHRQGKRKLLRRRGSTGWRDRPSADDRAAGLPTFGHVLVEKQARFLSPADTALLRDAIAARPDSTRGARVANARGRFTMNPFEHTGLRASEAIGCKMGHVMIEIETVPADPPVAFPDASPDSWQLRVAGSKGGKAR
jgi:hypothetical protein